MFTFEPQKVPGVILIKSDQFPDVRGMFFELYKEQQFQKIGVEKPFVQINVSVSQKNVLRGLHYQEFPKEQGKLVTVLRGAVNDVAVDIRQNSKHYLRWVMVNLSEGNKNLLWVPPGFAHGFLSLEDNTQFLYMCTNEYSQLAEKGIRYNDPRIGIDWNISNPILSDKDRNLPYINT